MGGITDLYVNNDRNESSNMILNPAPDPWRGVLLRILGGGVPPGSLNPDPISDQKMSFSTPVCRPGLKKYPFSAGWPYLACSRLSDSWGDSPVSSRIIVVFALSQLVRTQLSHSHNMNRLGLIRQKLYHHYQIRAQTKKIRQMHFEYFIFLFRSYSFGIETINTFILM